MTDWLVILAAVAGFVAGMLLYFAGIDVPYEEQTWKGESPREKGHRRKQRIMRIIGVLAAAIALAAAVGAALVGLAPGYG